MPDLNAGWAVLLVLSIIGGCGTRGSSPDADPKPGTSSRGELRGKVVVTGSEPISFLTLAGENGQSTILLGDLTPELRRLAGAIVRVQGVERDAGGRKGLEVESYEVLLIDGAEPVVGILAATPGGTSVVGKDTLELASVPRDLREKIGAKVWIVGRRSGHRIEIQSFGILRDATR